MSDDELCFVMALYGVEMTRDDIVPMVDEIAEFFRAAGHPLSHVEVDGRGFGRRPLQFKRAWKRLRKATAGDIERVDALAFMAGGESTVSDWIVTCTINPGNAYVQVGASLKVMPGAERRIVTFVRGALGGIRPAYGIGFVRERGRGPSLYGVGIGYGRELPEFGPVAEELEEISRWGHTGKRERVYARGILRDVYPYNLLSTCHLERDVGGGTLRAWIAGDAGRGQLDTWSDELAMWTVGPERVAAVRQALTGAGILYAEMG